MAERTLYCGQVSTADLGKEVTLKGWVRKRRDHGNLIFIDLRDREGFAQVVFNPEVSAATKAAWEIAAEVRTEYVLEVTGEVIPRAPEQINPNMKTGEIEIMATRLTVLNTSKTVPFGIDEGTPTNDELRLKYRYLDLRRPEMLATLKLRHQVTRSIRNFLDHEGFIDVI